MWRSLQSGWGNVAAATSACGRSMEEVFAGGKSSEVADAVAKHMEVMVLVGQRGWRSDGARLKVGWWPQEQSGVPQLLNATVGRLCSWLGNPVLVLWE